MTAANAVPPNASRSPRESMNRPNPLLVLASWLGFVISPAEAAAPADHAGLAPGTIIGRIVNRSTGEYVSNAEVRIVGRSTMSVSGAGGEFSLAGVAPGEATIVATFTGYRPGEAKVTVVAGGTVTKNLELVSTLDAAVSDGTDAPIRLGAITVASEREGNAKAIMRQRSSMDITNTVASDVFGDVAEGNVGEFLKHMPGVELDLVAGEVRTIRLRGLNAEYTQVTMDGISLASADANTGAAGNARAFSFEQVSLASMDAIEVSKTISADVDANAPAGTINLISKRAFDLAGRRVSIQANLAAFSENFSFAKSPGPDDSRSRKILPGGVFDYADVFFDRRLGITLNVSESNAYSENAQTTVTYNYTPTAADPRPVVPTAISFLHVPRINRRSTVNLTSDFKATPRLVLSLGLLYNYADLNNPQRPVTFSTGDRSTVVGADPALSFTTSAANASVSSSPNHIVKQGQTLTAVPRFEYKVANLTLEGKFAASNSLSWYNPLGQRGSVRNAGTATVSGIRYTARRSSLRSADWAVEQTAGLDIDSGANFTNGAITTVNDGRYARMNAFSGEIVGTLRTGRLVPVVWKAGIKRKLEQRDFRLERDNLLYNYVGPGAAALGRWAAYRSPNEFDMNLAGTGASLRSISGGAVFVPDLIRIGGLYRDNPSYFAKTMTATNYYNAFVINRRYYEEEIDAGFLMATATLGRAILRGGLRGEATRTDALEFDPRSPAELAAAGHPETNGVATTIPGLEYQFFSKPKVHRRGDYANLFPSASLKYKFNRNLDLHFGFSSTIRRPTFRDLAGVWVINDENLTVSAPNPGLKPETSKNFSLRLAYYFEPVGIFAINAFQNNVRDLFRSNRLTAQEFGYKGDLDLSNYEFITTTQSSDEVTVRGMEYEYSQSLSFLPGLLRGLNVRASYTRNYAEVLTANMIPHSVNAGVSYGSRRMNAYVNMRWRDNYPTTTSTTTRRFSRYRTDVDIGGSLVLFERTSVFFSARNIFNEPFLTMEQVGANPAAVQLYMMNGTNWTFGVKTVF